MTLRISKERVSPFGQFEHLLFFQYCCTRAFTDLSPNVDFVSLKSDVECAMCAHVHTRLSLNGCVFTGIDGVCVRCVTSTRLCRIVARGVSVPRYGALWRELVHCRDITSAVSFFWLLHKCGNRVQRMLRRFEE